MNINLIGACLLVTACSSATQVATFPAVAGTYTITRDWVTQGCTPPTSGATETVTGTITQNAGAADFALHNSDGGNFTGHLQADGTFTNGGVTLNGAGGVRYTILLEGRFAASTFEATLTGDQSRASGSCREVIAWHGTRTGR